MMNDKNMVTYNSSGNTLIICASDDLEKIVDKIKTNVQIDVALLDKINKKLEKKIKNKKITRYDAVTEIKIDGYLGNFKVIFHKKNNKGETISINKIYDLIVSKKKLFVKNKIFPIGYFQPENNNRLIQIVEKLDEWVGVFEKPVFFEYEKEKCARGNLGNGCDKCKKVCAAKAIVIKKAEIKINSHLCQGCGDCASICPAGAISFVYESRKEIIEKLKIKLQRNKKENKKLIVYQSDFPITSKYDKNIVYLKLKTIGSFGPEIALSAICYGAKSIYLHDYDGISEYTKENQMSQMAWVNELLCSLGYTDIKYSWINNKEKIRLYDNRDENIKIPVYNKDFTEGKQNIARDAIKHLIMHAPNKINNVKLPDSSPFGMITIKDDLCTLCMSCVSECPEHALIGSENKLSLKFIESNCVGCSVCEKTCPEKAIEVISGITCNVIQWSVEQVVHQDYAYYCSECGKFIGSQNMIKNIENKLISHPMYKGNKKKMLHLCADCKVRINISN